MGHTAGPSQEGTHAYLQLGSVEGFGQVVVGTGVEAGHFVFSGGKSSKHEDRNGIGLRILPEPLADRETVEIRHHDVEHD